MRKDICEATFMAKVNNIKINYSRIAKQYGCDPRTVKSYYERDETLPLKRKTRIIKRTTDGFEEIIKDKYLIDGAPAIAIYNLLKEKYKYKGSYSSIKRFTHSLKEEKSKEATVRFETSPGIQCQIDWKESVTLFNKNNEPITINIFLGILGYSRYKYIELTFDRNQPTLFKCLVNMFKYFDGVPKELLFDNMKTVVDRPRTQFNKVVFNDTFYSFSKDALFTPLACLPYTPKTKGKVETLAKVMNRLKVYNHEFSDSNDLYKIVNSLLDEINNLKSESTKEKPIDRFQKEKEYLSPLSNIECLNGYFKAIPLTRKVPKDSMIMYKENKYSVPEKYIGKIVTIDIKENYLYIYYNNSFITKHLISSKPFNYHKDHYITSLSHSVKDERMIEDMCETNLKIFDKLWGNNKWVVI